MIKKRIKDKFNLNKDKVKKSNFILDFIGSWFTYYGFRICVFAF